MIDVNELRRGTTFELDGQLLLVLDYSHNKPGRGNATIRTKVRNLRTGATFERTFQSGERVQDVDIERKFAQYLYHDGDFYNFMDTNSFEQFQLNEHALGDTARYLKENSEIVLLVHEGEPLDVELPAAVELVVTESPNDVAGDTAAGGGTKVVTMETGLRVTAPLFVQLGDTLRIDTRTGAYVTRV